MFLLIDNYDSFTYNLVHYLGELGAKVTVKRNDALTAKEALEMEPQGIILSPGPCDPDQAGICLELVAEAVAALAASDDQLEACVVNADAIACTRDGSSREQAVDLQEAWGAGETDVTADAAVRVYDSAILIESTGPRISVVAQSPVEFVGPRVVGTHDELTATRTLYELVGAVLANVVEASDHIVAAADAKKVLISDLESEIVTRLLDQRGVSGELPGFGKQPGNFPLEHGRIGVESRLERTGRCCCFARAHLYSSAFQ